MSGHPVRGERPFRALLAHGGDERWLETDVVLDATGVRVPTAVGAGGVSAPGEGAVSARMLRDLGALAARGQALGGRRVLLVGHGHSAANAIGVLAAIAHEAPSTCVVWAVRSAHLRPCVEVASDPLPERQRVVAAANLVAAKPPPWLRMERRAAIEGFAPAGEAVRVSMSGGRTAEVDDIVALTGCRPYASHLGELEIEVAPSTEGGARLARALASVTDCLSVPRVSDDDLGSGEPGFYLVGARAYGRARTFLLQTGYAQVEAILDRISA